MSGRDGVVLLDKPEGVSSFRALRPLKRSLPGTKIGHTGTLDPFASGLLVVLTGKLTRFAPVLVGLEKSYEATFLFGQRTDTLDPEGETIETGDVPDIERIEAVAHTFIGSIQQRPPRFSAIHVNGKRAYKSARDGEDVELPERPVRIDALEIMCWEAPCLTVRMTVSSGTYVRSVARDMGAALGTCAMVQKLRRTSVGRFSVHSAVDPDAFDPAHHVVGLHEYIDRFPNVRGVSVDKCHENELSHGVPFSEEFVLAQDRASLVSGQSDGSDIALFSETKRLLAVVYFDGTVWRYRFVVAEPQAGVRTGEG